ncbi:MAG: cadmium-translocating P-type ATPase [Candidatus Abyssobacteria bacterium SURF_5]|uniref:P-type Zn(2+) transporter n=1 Tax=Abyssobacteria bacterium (strain SURF_5) TaxID=2093360 RepID=A0A3A4NQS9_ABYX5|nr:MAG: cadmium-translocating P-type ATPase [Candidatus Abyssubacteria bacterium SURF_5]
MSGHSSETITKPTTEITIAIAGMDCPSCAEKVEKAVARMEGVVSAAVNFTGGNIVVLAEEGTDVAAIEQQVQKLGYKTGRLPGEATDKFYVEGMDCPDESSIIERKLRSLDGVRNVAFNLVSAEVTVSYDSRALTHQQLLRAIRETGMAARPTGAPAKKEVPAGHDQLVHTLAAGIFLAAGFILSLLGVDPLAVTGFYLLGMLFGGYHIYRKAVYSARSFTFDMNVLMTIAVIGAAAINEWLEAATVVFLFSGAQYLEMHTMDRARNAIHSLMKLAPENALVRRSSQEVVVPVSEVEIGEILIVRPGDKIPLDGKVIAGLSAVNQAPITGESTPVVKQKEDDVFAGTINGDGFLEVQATHRADDTTLARIIHLVEEAQAQRAPMQNFVDKFTKYYTPSVIALAALVVAVPPLAFGAPFVEWLSRGLVLLVIACPCALVISTPISIAAGLASAARHGVLIKGGIYLEKAGMLNAIAFDKTGTLTLGHPCVKEIIPLDNVTPGELLSIAASVESRSEHHLGRSIVEEARRLGIPVKPVEAFLSIPGKGAEATIDGKNYYVGSHRLFKELNFCTPHLDERMNEIEKKTQTVVLVGNQEAPLGIIVLIDSLRKHSTEALRRLRDIGIRKMIMITGDNRGTAEAIASQLGIEYRSELLPQDKVDALRGLVEEYEYVAMIGDGVNDAPALAASTIGVAMGTAGSDTALETADVALMADDLLKLPFAISLSRKTLAIIKQNIALSILIKLLFLSLAVLGLATLWMAVFADMGASLLVIFNGMRLLAVNDTLGLQK